MLGDLVRVSVWLAATAGVVGGVRWALRQLAASCADAEIDGLIARAAARPRFEGFDPELRTRTAARRRSAEALHQAGRRVVTKDRAGLWRVQ